MIVREERRERFTIVSNDAIEDARLSFQAKGLLIYLLSKPDRWSVSRDQLATVGPNGISSVRAILSELEENGYLTRVRKAGDGGKFSWESVVHERPIQPSAENPPMVSPPMVKPPVEKHTLVNTNRVNTEKANTDTFSTKANDEQEGEWEPGYPEPIPVMSQRRPRQPFQTQSQAQEQNQRRAKVFGWIYNAIHGQEIQSSPAPGTIKKYGEALDWFLSESITAEQICRAVASAKSKWHNLENLSVAINPKSLADNWHSLYTPPKPRPADTRTAAPQLDLSKPLMGLSRNTFIDHFAHWTPIRRWEVFAAWAEDRPDMLDHALYARELATAVEKAITFGKDRYAVEIDPKGLELEF